MGKLCLRGVGIALVGLLLPGCLGFGVNRCSCEKIKACHCGQVKSCTCCAATPTPPPAPAAEPAP